MCKNKLDDSTLLKDKINQLYHSTALKNPPEKFPDDGKLLENILVSYTAFKQISQSAYDSNQISNRFHHAGVEDRFRSDLTEEEMKLHQLNVNFNLVSHLELYIPLSNFLNSHLEKIEIISKNFHHLVLEHYKQFVGLEPIDNLQEEE